ncbi:MAG: VanZ family protein [Eubacteriales bacterium]|nr:VanZ family protein [Eubacteriales bacterium]
MGRFGNIDLMQLVLVAILLLCGYFFLFQAVAKRAASRSAIPVLAMVLLLVYLLIALPLVLIISQMGGMSFTFLALLILAAFIGLVAFLAFLFKNFRQINKGMLLLFLLYLLMTGYFTIFSRRGRVQTEIMLKFDSIEEAVRRRSLQPLQHLWLNVAMFVPLGMLFPAICPQHLNKLSCVLPLGMLLTTLIETTQLILRIGQCDLEDLVANTAGACLGLLLYRLYRRMAPERGTQ